MKKRMTPIAFIFLAINFYCCAQKEAADYQIATIFPVEGDGGWDYLTMDETTSRLFISHSSKTQVLDTNTGKLAGTIDDTNGVHGIAIDPGANRAFISCGRDSSITVVNLSTLKFITKIKTTGANPDAILYDPFSDRVFAFNGGSANATVIDPTSNTVVSTIPLAGKPEFSVSDGHGKVYVNIEDKSLITEINSGTLMVENTWPLAPGEEPSGLSLDTTNHRLFSVCRNKKMVVMDAQNGTVITSLDIGRGSDGCAFDPTLRRAYSSNGEGTLTIVQEEDANTFSVLNTIQTKIGARTIYNNAETHHLYLPTAELGPAPAATTEIPYPRPTINPGTFVILEIAPEP